MQTSSTGRRDGVRESAADLVSKEIVRALSGDKGGESEAAALEASAKEMMDTSGAAVSLHARCKDYERRCRLYAASLWFR